MEFPADRPAVARGALLDDIRHVDQLPPPDVARYAGVQVWLEGVRLIRQYFGDVIYIRGNCDQCPFSLASLVRSMDGWLLDLMDPDLEPYCTQLLDYCAAAGRQFLELMSATGADMVSNGDSTAGPSVISPRMYRRWALPYEIQFAEAAHRLGVRYAIHICGDTRAILPDLAACGADAVELDYKTDVVKAHDLLRDRATFIGNIDPSGVIALGTPEEITREARRLIELFSDTGRFILNAGCAIPADTPPENIRALVAAVH